MWKSAVAWRCQLNPEDTKLMALNLISSCSREQRVLNTFKSTHPVFIYSEVTISENPLG